MGDLISVMVVTKTKPSLEKAYFLKCMFSFPILKSLLDSFIEIPESHALFFLISYVATLDGKVSSVPSGYHAMNLCFGDCH